MRTLRSPAEVYDAIDEARIPFLLLVGASWCSPCTSLKPRVEKATRQAAESGILDVAFFDLDRGPLKGDPDRSLTFPPIRSIPALFWFHRTQGRPAVKRWTSGGLSTSQLAAWLEPLWAKPERKRTT